MDISCLSSRLVFLFDYKVNYKSKLRLRDMGFKNKMPSTGSFLQHIFCEMPNFWGIKGQAYKYTITSTPCLKGNGY